MAAYELWEFGALGLDMKPFRLYFPKGILRTLTPCTATSSSTEIDVGVFNNPMY